MAFTLPISTFRNVLGAALCSGLLVACAAGGIGGGDAPVSTSGLPNTQQDITGSITPTQQALRNRPGVKVALLLPLTAPGSGGEIGKALKQAGELALFDFDNPNVVLLTKDTKGSAEGAQAAAADAVRSGAELIVGPLFGKAVRGAAPVARQANVPVIGFSSDQGVAGNGVHLLSFVAGRDVRRIVSYAMARGKRKFAALIPKTAYGQIVETAFRQEIARQGGQILSLAHYPADPNAMLESVKQIAAVASSKGGRKPQVDALFIPAGPESLPTLASLLPYHEIDSKKVQLVGTGVWDYPNVGREKVLVGGWFPAPDPKGWRGFTQRYAATYGKTPPRLASLAYDAVSLAVSLSANPPGQRYGREQLMRRSGFAGVDGLFRLREDGTAERGLAILEVQQFGPQVLDQAPSVFGTAQF